jgi:hypothetical protein
MTEKHFPLHDLVRAFAAQYYVLTIRAKQDGAPEAERMADIYNALTRVQDVFYPISQCASFINERYPETTSIYKEAISLMEDLLPKRNFALGEGGADAQHFVYAERTRKATLHDNGKTYLVYYVGTAEECKRVVQDTPCLMHLNEPFTTYVAHTHHDILPLVLEVN